MTGVTLPAILASVGLSFLVSLMMGILRYGLYSLYLNRQFEQTVSPSDMYRGFREQPDRHWLFCPSRSLPTAWKASPTPP